MLTERLVKWVSRLVTRWNSRKLIAKSYVKKGDCTICNMRFPRPLRAPYTVQIELDVCEDCYKRLAEFEHDVSLVDPAYQRMVYLVLQCEKHKRRKKR